MRKSVLVLTGVLVAGALSLAACDDVDTATLKTICKALIGPIKYNSQDKASLYFAGRKLVFTLKQRNQVWDGLNCTSIIGAEPS